MGAAESNEYQPAPLGARRYASSPPLSDRLLQQDTGPQKETSCFDISCWTRLAEVCGEYLKKGRGVRVVGRLKQDRRTDADGKGHSKISIVAEHAGFEPQFKKGDGQDGDEKTDDASADEAAPGQVQEEADLTEAASFQACACHGGLPFRPAAILPRRFNLAPRQEESRREAGDQHLHLALADRA
jgi:single-strand DNA-binding protein